MNPIIYVFHDDSFALLSGAPPPTTTAQPSYPQYFQQGALLHHPYLGRHPYSSNNISTIANTANLNSSTVTTRTSSNYSTQCEAQMIRSRSTPQLSFIPPQLLQSNDQHQLVLTRQRPETTMVKVIDSNNRVMPCSIPPQQPSITKSTSNSSQLLVVDTNNTNTGTVDDDELTMLRLDVTDMLTSLTNLFNDNNNKNNNSMPDNGSPTASSTRSAAAAVTTTTTTEFNKSRNSPTPTPSSPLESSFLSCSSGDSSPTALFEKSIKDADTSPTKNDHHNVHKNNKIGKPENLQKRNKRTTVVTKEDSQRIHIINKSRFKEKKSRKRPKYPGESSLHVWKWMLD